MTTISKQQTKRHHYVPQFYLREFSTKKDKVYIINAYDKASNKIFPADVKNVCCEDYFNDVQNRTRDSFYEKPSSLTELNSGKKPTKL